MAKRSQADAGTKPATDAGTTPSKKEAPRAGSFAWFGEWGKTILWALLVFVIVRTFLLATVVITTGSMENTLLVGDYLMVDKLSYGGRIPVLGWRVPGFRDPRVDDIILFRADHAPGLDIIKRTVGAPGDTLQMVDGVLSRNGDVVDEPYAVRDPRSPEDENSRMLWQLEILADQSARGDYRPTRDNWGPLVVPEDRYFMMGDNRDHSLDSRYWGLVEREKVRGRPVFIYYSFDRNALKPAPFFQAARLGRIGPSP
ncbi:MAG: signal peptidase I [Gemmatimonadetes bacterium]|nr:signal peptidase I [Gemmatimonadota bacterium]